jgi:uncharacterized delta-60 repeat protein
MKHLRRLSCLVPALTFAARALSQSQLEWIGIHDGTYGQADYGRACAVDAAGNVIVAGRSYNPTTGVPPMPPTADFEVVKYSALGAYLWSARKDLFGGDEFALDVQCGPGGEVYVSGYTWASSNIEMALVKWNAAGAFEWSMVYAGPGSGSDFGRALAFDGSGNVLICGNESGAGTGNDAHLASYTPAGAVNWRTSFDSGSSADDALYALTVLPSGEILACGQFTNPASGGANVGVAKFSASGTLLWQRSDDGGGALVDGATAIAVVDASHVAVGGWRTSATGEDWLVSLYDHVGNTLVWTRTFNGSASGNDRVRSMALDQQGVLWVAGSTTSSGTGIDFATRRYDTAGSLLTSDVWNNASANLDDQPYKLLLGSAGQAYVAGSTVLATSPAYSVDVAVLQYDRTGARNWAMTFSSPGAYDDRALDFELAPNNKLAGGGYTSNATSGSYDYLAVQIDLNDSPQSYCTAKVNTLGCSAHLTFTGLPSAAATSGFTVSALPLRNQKSGLFFYSTLGAASGPFQGGYFCAQPPVRRAPLTTSGGNSAPPDDCSGVIAMDFNAFAHGVLGGVPAPELLVPGTDVYCEVWSRDPGASFQTNLSSALHFTVLP